MRNRRLGAGGQLCVQTLLKPKLVPREIRKWKEIHSFLSPIYFDSSDRSFILIAYGCRLSSAVPLWAIIIMAMAASSKIELYTYTYCV